MVLVFVGVKFIVSDIFGKVPIWVSLPFITTVVTVSIVASLTTLVEDPRPVARSATRPIRYGREISREQAAAGDWEEIEDGF